MQSAERSVLHVLPHPGGGGETYVDLLDSMPGYRFGRVYLAPSPRPSMGQLALGVARAWRQGPRYDLVHAHGEVAAGLCLPLLVVRPSVVTLNGLHLVRRVEGVRRRAAELNLRAVVRAADQTICVSGAERAYLGEAIGPVAGPRVVVIHNGVHVPSSPAAVRLEVRRELGIGASEPVGIWVGALDGHKDPLTAVRAATEASVTLLVVGEGPLREQVVESAGESVHVLGHRPDVPRLLGAADFFVLTSRREGLSFALLEAMARGLPAVVTAIPENVEAVGDSGMTVHAGDVDSLTRALRRVATGVEERTESGLRAHVRAAHLFGAEQMVARTRLVFDDVIPHRYEAL